MIVNARMLALLVALSSCAVPGENTSTTQQGLNTFSSTVNSLAPEAFWRLGDVDEHLYDFGYSANDGEYFDVELGADGAITGDPNTAVRFPGHDPGYGEVRDSEIHSLTRAWDDFPTCTLIECSGWSYSGRYSGEVYGTRWNKESGYDYQEHFWDGNFSLDNGAGVMASLGGPDHHLVMQQGLPEVGLGDGDMQVRAEWNAQAVGGPYEPVGLVARWANPDNFVRAELQLDTDDNIWLRLISTEDGVDSLLATEWVGVWQGGWWYIRFQFEGPFLRARAWPKDTPQPDTWAVSSDYSFPENARYGTVALRASNENTESTPTIMFDDFWVQTLGITLSLFVYIEDEQSGVDESSGYLLLWGKGNRVSSLLSVDGNQEYHFRYTPGPEGEGLGALRGYVFNLGGRLGAGQAIENIHTNQWYQLVMELDSGDALDPNAGVTLYVNGTLDEDGDHNPVPARIPHAGSWYNGAKDCDADGKFPLNAPMPGLPGLCTDQDGDRNFECLSWSTGKIKNCWTIFPKNGDAPLRFGTVNGGSWFAGRLDEAIIFDRKLDASEVWQLYQASQ